MTAEEYLDYLITVAKSNTEIGVQASELEFLKRLITERKPWIDYTPLNITREQWDNACAGLGTKG